MHKILFFVGFVGSFFLLASVQGRPIRARSLPKPTLHRKKSPLKALKETPRLETVARYLKELGYSQFRVDEAQDLVQVNVRGQHGLYEVYVLPRGSLVHFQVPRLFAFQESKAEAEALKRVLLELNWSNFLGKYGWDPEDGEVRFSYALVAPAGMSFQGFALALAQSLTTIDQDMPRIQKLLPSQNAGKAKRAPVTPKAASPAPKAGAPAQGS